MDFMAHNDNLRDDKGAEDDFARPRNARTSSAQRDDGNCIITIKKEIGVGFIACFAGANFQFRRSLRSIPRQFTD